MTITTTARMHVSLNVARIDRSVPFYTALFGVEPTKQRADYAKFTLDEPGLVLSLNVAPATRVTSGADGKPGAALSHLGFQVAGDEELDAARARIAAAGLEIALDEPGVTCCYAVQNKFWVIDPDGNAWEYYRFLDDADTHSTQSPDSTAAPAAGAESLAEAGSAGAAGTSGCCPGEAPTCCP